MLPIERLHVLLHNLARGSRNQLASLKNYYDLFDVTQTSWRFEGEWSTPPKQSTLAALRVVPGNEGIVKRLGQSVHWDKISKSSLNLVSALWATVDPAYDRFRDRYLNYVRNQKRKNHAVLSMRRWEPAGVTPQEKLWQRMSHYIRVSHTLHLFTLNLRTQIAVSDDTHLLPTP